MNAICRTVLANQSPEGIWVCCGGGPLPGLRHLYLGLVLP